MPQAQAEASRPSATAASTSRKLIEGARHIEVQVLGDGERRHPLLRARMLAAAAPSEGLGGSALAVADTGHSREALRVGRRARQGGPLPRRRHDRISLRRPQPRVLFHRDEHPHPGRASGDGDGHRHRPRARDDPDRRRRAAALPPGSGTHQWPRDRGAASTPRIRRKASCRARAPSPTLNVPGGHGVRFDSMLYPGYTVPPFYDSPARQADRPRRDRASAIRGSIARSANCGSRGWRRPSRCIRRSPRDPDVQAGRFHTRWLEPWLASNAANRRSIAPAQIIQRPRESVP